MGTVQLIGAVRHYFSTGQWRQFTPCAQLDALLGRLRVREHDLEHRLEHESRAAKRRRLALELQVTRIQQKKGVARRLELDGQCH